MQVWKGMIDEANEDIPAYLVAIKTVKVRKEAIAQEKEKQDRKLSFFQRFPVALRPDNEGASLNADAVAESIASSKAADDLMNEAQIMAQVGRHPNIVSLVGVVSNSNPVMLIVSFCEHGALLDVLRLKANDQLAARSGKGWYTAENRLQMLLEVAQGMEHLSLSFVHRDLAARNVLIDSAMVCRVADFGLSRGYANAPANGEEPQDDYYRSTAGMFPVQSTAPEAMLQQKFSQKSDVWSFSILAIEIYTDGSRPYGKVSNADLPMQVCSGLRPAQPQKCDSFVWELLQQCWASSPSDRPSFTEIIATCKTIQNASGWSKAVPKTNQRSPSTYDDNLHNEYVDMDYIEGSSSGQQHQASGVDLSLQQRKSLPKLSWVSDTSNSSALASPNHYTALASLAPSLGAAGRRSVTSPALLPARSTSRGANSVTSPFKAAESSSSSSSSSASVFNHAAVGLSAMNQQLDRQSLLVQGLTSQRDARKSQGYITIAGADSFATPPTNSQPQSLEGTRSRYIQPNRSGGFMESAFTLSTKKLALPTASVSPKSRRRSSIV